MSVQLGCRSPLVLAKLGFDLRSQLEDTFAGPIPTRIQRLADQIDGYVAWRDVGRPYSDGASWSRMAEPSPEQVWRDLVEADQPFRFS